VNGNGSLRPIKKVRVSGYPNKKAPALNAEAFIYLEPVIGLEPTTH
jgi:hypothetical protein